MFKSDLLIIWYHATKLEQDSLIEHAYNSLKKEKLSLDAQASAVEFPIFL
ncbi:hypothetical protein T15_0085 [Streptococcus suis T15]|nr:hypothetical protein T15_0085 [Streptococcus suis T15]